MALLGPGMASVAVLAWMMLSPELRAAERSQPAATVCDRFQEDAVQEGLNLMLADSLTRDMLECGGSTAIRIRCMADRPEDSRIVTTVKGKRAVRLPGVNPLKLPLSRTQTDRQRQRSLTISLKSGPNDAVEMILVSGLCGFHSVIVRKSPLRKVDRYMGKSATFARSMGLPRRPRLRQG